MNMRAILLGLWVLCWETSSFGSEATFSRLFRGWKKPRGSLTVGPETPAEADIHQRKKYFESFRSGYKAFAKEYVLPTGRVLSFKESDFFFQEFRTLFSNQGA